MRTRGNEKENMAEHITECGPNVTCIYPSCTLEEQHHLCGSDDRAVKEKVINNLDGRSIC